MAPLVASKNRGMRVEQCRLATAGAADDSAGLAGFESEGEVSSTGRSLPG